MKGSASTRWFLAALLAAALALPATAGAVRQTPAARAKHALSALGYRHLHVFCARTAHCRWRGIRGTSTCSGAIAARKRTRSLRVYGVRCTAPSSAGRQPLLFGFNAYITPTTVAKQQEVGAPVARLFVNWWDVEPQSGAWNWKTTDQQYREILAGGLRPLIVVNGAPCWAEASCSLTFAEPPTPSHDGDWSAYVRAVAARYSQAIGIEVWNEPNLASAFYPQVDPKRYTQLLGEAYAAVKSVNKAMPVISGGLAMSDGTGASPAGYNSRTFLADMYADGARRVMDGLGIHVYPTNPNADGTRVWNPAAMSRWLQQVKDVGTAAGVSAVPLWITEMGVSTATQPGFPPAVTPDQQASDLLQMVQIAQADPSVRLAIIDTLQDAAFNPVEDLVSLLAGSLLNYDVFYNGVIEGLGVFSSNWAPKPAACDLSSVFGGTVSCSS
jgi:hypothetical protein